MKKEGSNQVRSGTLIIVKSFCFIIAILIVTGCGEDGLIDSGEPFQITILSQEGIPVEGATIEGGIDWDFYKVQTDEHGIAVIPGSVRGERATIYKTNFLPRIVSSINPNRYTLTETSKRFSLIGSVSGKAVRFFQDQLITLDYGGTYHLYSYNDQSVSETFNIHLHDSATAIREIQLIGDTLWFTTHNSGVFIFMIGIPSSPAFLFRLPVTGYLGPFVVKDSILVLADQWHPGPLRVIVYHPSGEYEQISSIQNYFVRKMTMINDALIVIGNSESLPTIFDLSNPRLPRVLYNGLEWEYQSGFIHNELVILTPRYGYGSDNISLDYKVLNLSDASNPTSMNPFIADSWITGIAGENWAFGNNYYHSETICVLNGSISSGFQTTATVSENTIDGVGGAYPPYYIIGSRLWKLVERD